MYLPKKSTKIPLNSNDDKNYRHLMANIPGHLHRGSGSGKTNVLLDLKKNRPDIEKIYRYAKDPYEAKYQFLIKKREDVGIE